VLDPWPPPSLLQATSTAAASTARDPRTMRPP
jgi:hypothetical protein